MASLSARAVRGVGREALEVLIAAHGEGSIPAAARYDALARFEELPVTMAAKPGRAWKHDLAKLDLSQLEPFERHDGPELDVEALQPAARHHGVVIEHFSHARARHRDAFERAFGTALDSRDDKFASLALAFQNHGVFIDVPAGVTLNEPLVVGYEARQEGLFPYTLVSIGADAHVTFVERLAGAPAARFVCGVTELVIGPNAHLTYAVDQRLPAPARAIFTRRARLGSGAALDLALAELGGLLSVSRARIEAAAEGSRTTLAAVFFANEEQHVHLETEVVHAAGHTASETVVRSAGTGRGQGRFFGNIMILPHAHGAEASLKDDALLLSEGAHIDSVPALEIAANDVKAFHGATVGAISEDEIFYAQSRGIARDEAERMIALGFFEPALARFPGESLRGEIRGVLAAKLGAGKAG
ncbi:MAG: SufD family Fe-S cluster assembly protein [Candidatus Baltobacteraceae bacterium]